MYRDSLDGERHAALRARLAELRKNEREAREIERFLALEDRRLTLPLLDNLRIASPCAMEWDEMKGDERIRYCGKCRKNVYNLSAMTREQAEKLVFEKEGAMCARFYRRSDGTILTSDCPTGSRRVRWVRGVLASALATLLAAVGIPREVSKTPPPPSPSRPPESSAPALSKRDRARSTGVLGMLGNVGVESAGSRFTGFEILDR